MTRLKTRLWFVAILVAVLGLGSGAQAQLAPPPPAPPTEFGAVGPVDTDLGGFPQYYTDGAGRSLMLCANDPNCLSFNPGVDDEGFWWAADAIIDPPLVGGGKAILVLALEAAYAGDGSVQDGNQMVFGRIRIRVDVPVPGDYTVTHPYGTKVFKNVTVADGINYTEDIGAFDPLLGEILPKADGTPSEPPTSTSAQRVENNFKGALASPILESFLTWPNYTTLDEDGIPGPDLLINGVQYIGNFGIPHVVTGSPLGAQFNVFRVQGPNGISAETNLFTVSGKVLPNPAPPVTAHVYPPVEPKKLENLGPLYRPGGAPGYPVGYPVYYEDRPIAPATEGLRLTICPAIDPMCISAPVDPLDPVSVALNTGDEGFYWAADARLNTGLLPGGRAGRGLLVLALEAAFGGDGSVIDGNQMVFGRIRIRIDTPRAGTYTVTHPYGTKSFQVTQADMDATGGRRAINYTEDIGGFNPFQYDATFRSIEPNQMFDRALYSKIGPNFLTWTTFPNDPLLKRPSTTEPPVDIQYIGDPAVEHAVTGSPFGTNFFRVVGPGVNVQTNLFTVSGKIYDPATFEVFPPTNPNTPVAVNDVITVNQNGVAANFAILANDTLLSGAPLPGGAIVTLGNPVVTGPENGTVTLNANGTVTYRPNPGFFGTDSFTYTITLNGLTSNVGTVTVTVRSTEVLTVTTALVDFRGRLATTLGPLVRFAGRTNLRTVPGQQITIHAGTSLADPVIGVVTANRVGNWLFNRRIPGFTLPPGVTTVFVVSSGGGTAQRAILIRR